MRIRTLALVAVATLGLAACSNDQGDVADAMVEQAADAGMTLDKACVSTIAENMSDEDVKSLEEGSDLTTSEEGNLLLTRMAIECGSAEEIASVFLADLPDDGTIDKQCIADALKAADLTAGVDAAMTSAMTACVTGG